MSSMYLVVGLGNPGSQYAHTRHNIGFDAVDVVASRYQIPIQQNKFSALIGSGLVQNVKVCLVKPQTYMNLSGKSVAAASQFYSVEPDHVVVVHDDLDLELGQIKLKLGGGHGGHNGLRDIIKLLGTKDFLRVRLGIGRPQHGDVTNYVLGQFLKSEGSIVDDLLYNGANAVEKLLVEGLAKAQLEFHS